jgi:hypothetical protein
MAQHLQHGKRICITVLNGKRREYMIKEQQ